MLSFFPEPLLCGRNGPELLLSNCFSLVPFACGRLFPSQFPGAVQTAAKIDTRPYFVNNWCQGCG
jgi:hypothetical protein